MPGQSGHPSEATHPVWTQKGLPSEREPLIFLGFFSLRYLAVCFSGSLLQLSFSVDVLAGVV
jgi:hypothetical protein